MKNNSEFDVLKPANNIFCYKCQYSLLQVLIFIATSINIFYYRFQDVAKISMLNIHLLFKHS